MKFICLAAATALAILPVAGLAQSTAPSQEPAIEPGGVAQGDLEEFTLESLPFEAYTAGGFVLIGGAVVGVLIGSNDDDDTVSATTTTN